VTQQLSQITEFGGAIRLWEHPGSQQVRERLGVDRVGLHPGGGDRPGPERVREMNVVAGVLEQLGEPLPAIGRLKRDMRSAGVAKQLSDRLASSRDALGDGQLSVLVDDRDLRSAAVQVDADPPRRVRHGRSSSQIVRPRGRNPRGLQACGSGPRTDLLLTAGSVASGAPRPQPFMTSTSHLR
jgi:hypothetical protein